MGGFGSTRWNSHSKRQTVEACLMLSVSYAIGRLPAKHVLTVPGVAGGGQYVWRSTRTGDISGVIGWSLVNNDGAHPALVLSYSANRESQKSIVPLVSTPCNYGGVRWWFSCPSCGQRVGRLHLPPGRYEPRFACRKCQSLTYTSAQTAHDADRDPMIGSLIRATRLLGKCNKLSARLQRAHPGSKRWQRLLRKEFGLYAEIDSLLKHSPAGMYSPADFP